MKIALLTADDWIAVYKDGEKVWENHSCPLQEGLEMLGIEFERHEVPPNGRYFSDREELETFYDGSEFPEHL